jgi:hypothetical protein
VLRKQASLGRAAPQFNVFNNWPQIYIPGIDDEASTQASGHVPENEGCRHC